MKNISYIYLLLFVFCNYVYSQTDENITQIDTSICYNDSIFIEGAYQKVSGYYYDTLQDIYGEDSIIVTYLNVIQKPVTGIISGDELLCGGDYYNYITSGDKSLLYSWWIEGDLVNKPSLISSGNSTKLYLNSAPWEGDIYVYSETNLGCLGDTSNMSIRIKIAPDLKVSSDTIICNGDSAMLHAYCTESIVWNTDDTTSFIKVAPVFSTPYYVTASNDNCSVTKTVNVFIYQIPKKPLVNDTIIRISEGIPFIEATGTNIQWYDDADLSTLLHVGNIYKPDVAEIATYEFFVTQSDEHCESLPSMSVLTILADNYLPVLNDIEFTISENTASGSLVKTLEAIDPDEDQKLMYSIINASPAGYFNIIDTTGSITLLKEIDYETDTMITLQVKVSDNSTQQGSDTATVLIYVQNINESPFFKDIHLFRIDGVLDKGEIVAIIQASDPDGDNLKYSFIDNSVAGVFEIAESTGKILSLKDTILYRLNEYSFLINVSDKKLSATELVMIIVETSPLEKPVDNPDFITKENSSDHIKIFPNPIIDNLYLELSEISEIKLVSICGQILYSQNSYKNSSEINMAGFNSGIYFLIIEGEKANYQFKIIKK